MAIIRAAPIKNSKAPVYLSAWIFYSLQHLFPFYKVFYFTTSVELGFFPSALFPLVSWFRFLAHCLSSQRAVKRRKKKKAAFYTCSAHLSGNLSGYAKDWKPLKEKERNYITWWRHKQWIINGHNEYCTQRRNVFYFPDMLRFHPDEDN